MSIDSDYIKKTKASLNNAPQGTSKLPPIARKVQGDRPIAKRPRRVPSTQRQYNLSLNHIIYNNVIQM